MSSGSGRPGGRDRRIAPDAAADARLTWTRDGQTWPNRTASRFVEAGGLTWHVQVAGTGPALLLVHGTGASTHSYRDLLPRLAADFTVIAPDLPGHAFTGTPASNQMSLPGMAAALADLVRVLRIDPRIAVGHSAGAAILARMALDRTIAPAGLISLNGAMLPIGGIAGQVFSPLAKFLASTSLASRLFARWASDRDVVDRFIGQTGSVLDGGGMAFYARLARDPSHAAGALTMMAGWDLAPLVKELPALPVPLLLIVGNKDGSISPSDAFRIRDLVPTARVETWRGLGHLAHEEAPQRTADAILAQARRWGVGTPAD